MSIELTDAKRYELEKDNVINTILNANRRNKEITPQMLSDILKVDLPTINKLLTALRNENIIK